MASTRAPAVAEILWELKRVDKVAKYSAIAERAGFSAGATGRAMITCLSTIQKEWPHLQAWRAIRDDGTVQTDSEQSRELQQWGATLSPDTDGDRSNVQIDEDRVMVWGGATGQAASELEASETTK